MFLYLNFSSHLGYLALLIINLFNIFYINNLSIIYVIIIIIIFCIILCKKYILIKKEIYLTFQFFQICFISYCVL